MTGFLRFLVKAAFSLTCGLFLARLIFGFMHSSPVVSFLALPASIILFFSITGGAARIFDDVWPPRLRPPSS
jgi:hypothetical protein